MSVPHVVRWAIRVKETTAGTVADVSIYMWEYFSGIELVFGGNTQDESVIDTEGYTVVDVPALPGPQESLQ